MLIALSTLGCPAWTLDQIIERIPATGADALDFRGTAEALDITTLPAFTIGLADTAKRIADAGLRVTAISSGLCVCDPAKRDANLEEAKRTIPVALALGATMVRVFGNGPLDDGNRAELARHGAETLDRVARLPGAEKIDWLMETHDHWIAAPDLRRVLDAVTAPNVGVLWDIAHTLRFTAETFADSIAAHGPRLRNIHVKDARRDGDKWREVFPGDGELPLVAAIDALFAAGYDGPVTFEHEKRWIPELADPEDVFPRFVAWARRWKR